MRKSSMTRTAISRLPKPSVSMESDGFSITIQPSSMRKRDLLVQTAVLALWARWNSAELD